MATTVYDNALDIIENGAEVNQLGYSCTSSADGTIVAISSPFANGDTGEVRFFEWNGYTWDNNRTTLFGAAGSRFGHSVSLSANGSIVAISSIYNATSPYTTNGAVFVFRWGGTTWSPHGNTITGGYDYEQIGTSVSLSADGTVVAIGSHYNNGSSGANSNIGSIRVLEFNTTNNSWNSTRGMLYGDAAGDKVGSSVSLSNDGNTVAFGSRLAIGYVKVVEWDPIATTWKNDRPNIVGSGSGSNIGASISLSADGLIVAIGELNHHVSAGTYAGRVLIIEWDPITTAWKTDRPDIEGTATNQQIGARISLSDDGNIVAVSRNSSTDINVYQLNSSSTWDLLGSVIVGAKNPTSWLSISADGRSLIASSSDSSGTGSGIATVFGYHDTGTASTSYWTQNRPRPRFTIYDSTIDINEAGDGADPTPLMGHSVSLNTDGTILAVSEPQYDDHGRVRFFEWNPITYIWDNIYDSIEGSANYDFFGGSVSLSADGTVVAIGANDSDVGDGGVASTNIGSVQCFRWDTINNVWDPDTIIYGISAWDKLGYQVALSSNGSVLAASAYGMDNADGVTNGVGGVRVFDWNGSVWSPRAIIYGDNAGDLLGGAMSLSDDGNTVAFGRYGYSNGTGNVGIMKISNWDGANWDHRNTIYGNDGDELGLSVSLSADGSIMAIGLMASNNYAGQINVYKWNPDIPDWDSIGYINDGEINDRIGGSVSLSDDGETLAIGGVYANNFTGSTRVYKWDGLSTWDLKGFDIDGEVAGDRSGKSVSLSNYGNTVSVGAREHDTGGHARVFGYFDTGSIESSYWSQKFPVPTPPPTPPAAVAPTTPPTTPPPPGPVGSQLLIEGGSLKVSGVSGKFTII
jgi:hypothetical protein